MSAKKLNQLKYFIPHAIRLYFPHYLKNWIGILTKISDYNIHDFVVVSVLNYLMILLDNYLISKYFF